MTISEAARHLPDAMLERHREVPWPDIRGIGNHIRHAYWKVDSKIVWEVVQHNLGALEAAVRAELPADDGVAGS